MVAGHVQVSDTEQLDSIGGAIKGPHTSLVGLSTQFNLQIFCDTLLSSQPLSSKLRSNPSFIGEI
jgi:hypothetical protein